MDKKAKKRLEVLRQKLQKQEKLLAAAKQQTDEPDEVANIERQINEIKTEIEKIKNGWLSATACTGGPVLLSEGGSIMKKPEPLAAFWAIGTFGDIYLSHTDLTVSKRALHLMPAGIWLSRQWMVCDVSALASLQ